MARPQPTTSRSRSVAHPAAVMALTDILKGNHRQCVRAPFATLARLADEPPPFLSTTNALQCETTYPVWRERLTSPLSRRGDGPWEPLTFVHKGRK